jgi:hypothetical protein
MNRSKLLAALLVLAIAACGTVGVQGDRCEIGRAQSCPCASGAVDVQECSPAGVYGACSQIDLGEGDQSTPRRCP